MMLKRCIPPGWNLDNLVGVIHTWHSVIKLIVKQVKLI